MIKRTLLAAALFLGLVACATPEPIPVATPTYINIQVPASVLRSCPEFPVPPSREYLISLGDEAQSVVTAWMLDAYGVYESCDARHNGLITDVKAFQERIIQLNAESAQN